MDCMQYANPEFFKSVIKSFNTASGMDCMQFNFNRWGEPPFVVSIPQAVWIACNGILLDYLLGVYEFQYRKRYGLHAIVFKVSTEAGFEVSIPQAVWIACNIINLREMKRNFMFQYRKRYGLHAIGNDRPFKFEGYPVSIPQAVWIACNSKTSPKRGLQKCFNTASGMDCMQLVNGLR